MLQWLPSQIKQNTYSCKNQYQKSQSMFTYKVKPLYKTRHHFQFTQVKAINLIKVAEHSLSPLYNFFSGWTKKNKQGAYTLYSNH